MIPAIITLLLTLALYPIALLAFAMGVARLERQWLEKCYQFVVCGIIGLFIFDIWRLHGAGWGLLSAVFVFLTWFVWPIVLAFREIYWPLLFLLAIPLNAAAFLFRERPSGGST